MYCYVISTSLCVTTQALFLLLSSPPLCRPETIKKILIRAVIMCYLNYKVMNPSAKASVKCRYYPLSLVNEMPPHSAVQYPAVPLQCIQLHFYDFHLCRLARNNSAVV